MKYEPWPRLSSVRGDKSYFRFKKEQTLGISEPRKRRKSRSRRNDEDNSDSYKQGLECWISGNRGNHGKVQTTHAQTTSLEISKVPEGHHPRGTTLREALRGNLPLRGLCGVSPRVLRGSLQGLCGALRGSAGVREIFRGFSGVVTLCL